MKTKIGFIGAGNMGGALIKGLSAQKQFILNVYDLDSQKIENLSQEADFLIAESVQELSKNSDYIILAVKPQHISSVINQILPQLGSRKCLISIAAGIKLESLAQFSQNLCPLVRVMPNTPALIGKGVFALCFDHPELTSEQKETVLSIFSSLGKTYVLEEKLFDGFTAMIGSGPAFVFLILESFVQAGITLGFTAKQSKEMALALFEGSVELAQKETLTLSELKEMVSSPAGTTIYGLNKMEEKGLRTAILEGILASFKRSKEL